MIAKTYQNNRSEPEVSASYGLTTTFIIKLHFQRRKEISNISILKVAN